MVFPTDGDRLLRAWGPPDDPWVLGVEEDGRRWRVTVWGATSSEGRTAVRSVFSFDHDLARFYAMIGREPVLRTAARRFRGLRLPRDAHLYESLLHSIIGQQLSVTAANTIKGRLYDAARASIEVDGIEVPRTPTPSEIHALGPGGLRSIGLSRVKSSSILHLAERERVGAFDPTTFRTLPVDEAIARLDEEPGVGRWTAENALLRGVGRTDLFVAGDLGIRVALHAYGAVGRDAPEAEARAWADRWYPSWGSYATLYLWRQWVADGAPSEPITGKRPARGGPRRRPGGSPRRGSARST